MSFLDKTLLVSLVGLVLFASPLVRWWPAIQPPWYFPYALWAVLILLIIWAQARRSRHGL